MQATTATARSNTLTALDRTSAARPVPEKSFPCCTASQGLVPPHRPREAITRVIHWLPADKSLFFGSSSDFHSASPSPVVESTSTRTNRSTIKKEVHP